MNLVKHLVRRSAGALAACAALLSPLAHAQSVGAPDVTVGADIKQLRFDWDPVPNANSYALLFKANPSAKQVRFFTLPASQTTVTNNIAVHLFDWDRYSYYVRACNASESSCSEGWLPVEMKALMQDAIGYFKPSVTNRDANFGHRVALAEDGNTFAVLAQTEPTANSHAAPFYVFTKSNGNWRQQTRIYPSSTVAGRHNVGIDSFYTGALALSQDGNTLLVAMPFRIAPNYLGYRNSISVYQRVNNVWSREFQAVSPIDVEGIPVERTFFARMNLSGNRIVYRLNNSKVEMVERGASGWQARTIAQPPSGCSDTKMSGDGATVAFFCASPSNGYVARVFMARADDWDRLVTAFDVDFPQGHKSNGLALNYDATRIAVSSIWLESSEGINPEVRVYKWNGSAAQQFGSTQHRGAWSADGLGFRYGDQLEFSRNGSYLAVVDESDQAQGTGVWSPPLFQSRAPRASGAVYIYEFPASGPRLRRVVKPNHEGADGFSTTDISFANDGRTLLIGEPHENSKTTGIDGDRNDFSKPRAGAVWLY